MSSIAPPDFWSNKEELLLIYDKYLYIYILIEATMDAIRFFSTIFGFTLEF
jgi:hypothetical protein